MLNGGLMPRRPYLVVGASGTGKTTLALQFLCEGVRRGEETLVVTLEEPPNEMRFNHRALLPDLDRVWVFDAIPDVMRYERAPFKDVAQVRDATRFREIPPAIRKTPELTSVEVTLTALEQTLKMQKARRKYQRLVIDSLTALQYFCMKGLDEVQGAQSFLRFLSDLGATTLLTIEAPLEDVETPERMLARGEVRLFRWDLEGRTVRAIGVEKFRGSSHDIRLHPYRIGRQGLDINLEETVSRDTRRVLHAALPAHEEHVAPIVVTVAAVPAGPVGPEEIAGILTGVSEEIQQLREARVDLGAIRGSLESARHALVSGATPRAQAAVAEVRGLIHQMRLGHWSTRSRPAGEPLAPAPRAPPEMPDQPLPHEQLQQMVDHLIGEVGAPPVESVAPARRAPEEPPAPPAVAVEILGRPVVPPPAAAGPDSPPDEPRMAEVAAAGRASGASTVSAESVAGRASTVTAAPPSELPPPTAPPAGQAEPEPAPAPRELPPAARELAEPGPGGPNLPSIEPHPAGVTFGPTFETLAPAPPRSETAADAVSEGALPAGEGGPGAPAPQAPTAPPGASTEEAPKRKRRTAARRKRAPRPADNPPPGSPEAISSVPSTPDGSAAPASEPPVARRRAPRRRRPAAEEESSASSPEVAVNAPPPAAEPSPESTPPPAEPGASGSPTPDRPEGGSA